MTNSANHLENEALSLSTEERARLARLLLESLDEDSEHAADVARAWEAEVERRVAAFRSGAVDATSASDVFREARSNPRHE